MSHGLKRQPRITVKTVHPVVIAHRNRYGWPLWAARNLLERGYTLEQTIALTGWAEAALVSRG